MHATLGLRNWLLVLACGAAACGGGNGATSGDGGADGGMPPAVAPGQIALRIEQARLASRNGTVQPLNITVTVANGAGGAPVPLNPLLFQVRTSDGLLHVGGSSDGWVVRSDCDATISVGPDAHTTCTLGFDLKKSTGPTDLVYSAAGVSTGLGDTRTASAKITVEACTMCDKDCTYLDIDGSNCGKCGFVVYQSIDAKCIAGLPVCDKTGLSYCVQGSTGSTAVCTDLQTDNYNCGACGNTAENADCINGAIGCKAPETLQTVDGRKTCLDLTSDQYNCGAVGKVCTAISGSTNGPQCHNSKCGGTLRLTQTTSGAPTTCTQVCARTALVCDDTFFTQGSTSGGAAQGNTLYPCSTVWTSLTAGPVYCGCESP